MLPVFLYGWKKAVSYSQKQQQKECKRTASKLTLKERKMSEREGMVDLLQWEECLRGYKSRGAQRSVTMNCFYSQHWYQLHGGFSHHGQNLQFSGHQLGVLLIQFIPDTNHLELAQTPQLKGSVPQYCPHFRC